MPGTVKQFVDYSNNTNSDTGENNATSVQPILNGETVNETVLNRPSESLRQRTEAIRSSGTDSLYLRDADRTLVIAGPGRVTWPGSTTVAQTGIPVLSDSLWILPMLTPGFAQVAPVPPVASVFGTLHLKRASDSMNSIVVTSMRRSYAAGDQINITVAPGAVFSCVLDTETTYQRTIRIVAAPATDLTATINALNALLPTAPDNTQLVTAALEGGALGTDLLLTTQAKQYVAGNYDGEGHTITPANLASFFVSNPTSALAEGDTLCVQYDMVSDTASTGGRRQAIPENTNTAIPAAAFFNSRINPEKLVNALPVCKVISGALVFGTGVEIPAGSTNQSLSVSDPGSRVIRNNSFEDGVVGGTPRFSITDWEHRTDLAVNGLWRLGTATPLTGGKHLELNKSAVGGTFATLEQKLEIPVKATQTIRVVVSVRQLIAPTAGTYLVHLHWGDVNGVASGSTAITLQVLASVDAGYRTIDQTIAVPAGKHVLKQATIEASGVTAASTGVALLVDDLQVYVETPAFQTPAVDNSRLRPTVVDALIVGDPLTYNPGELAALLRFNKSTPVGEGALSLERKDLDDQYPPALRVLGRLIDIGAQMLFGAAESRLPRLSAPYSGNDPFTLLWQSVNDQGAAFPAIRMYAVGPTLGSFFITINASYNGTNWVKDLNGTRATRVQISTSSVIFYVHDDDAAWVDGEWWPSTQFGQYKVATANGHVTPPRLSFFSPDPAIEASYEGLDHIGMAGMNQTWLCQSWIGNLTGTPPNTVLTGPGGTWSLNAAGAGCAIAPSYGNSGFLGYRNLEMTVDNNGSVKAESEYLMDAGNGYGNESVHVMTFELDASAIAGFPQVEIAIGFMHDAGVFSADGVFLQRTAADSSWHFVVRNNGAATNIDLGFNMSVFERWRIELWGSDTPGGARAVLYSLDSTASRVVTTNLPNVDPLPIAVWMKSTSFANQTAWVSAINYRCVRRNY